MRAIVFIYILLLLTGGFAVAQPAITKGTATFTEGCLDTLTLTNIVITESATTDFAASQTGKTYVLQAPAGFDLIPGVGAVSHTNGRDITASSISVTSTTITLTISTDADANKIDVITISGLQLALTTGTAAGSPYSINYDAPASTGSWNTSNGVGHADLVVGIASTKQSNGTGGGNWGSASTWTGGVVPSTCDNVIIKAGDIVTVEADKRCVDLQVEPGATLTHDPNDDVYVTGDYINNGAHSGGNASSKVFLLGYSGITVDGSGSMSVSGGIEFRQNYSFVAAANMTFSQDITVNAGVTITNNGTVTTANWKNITGSGTWTNASGSTLNLGGNISTTLTASASPNTVKFQNAGGQNVNAITYHNLTIAGSGTKTLLGAITVNNDLTISGGTLAAAGFVIEVGGDWNNTGGAFTHGNNQVKMVGAAAQTIRSNASNFYDLRIDNSAGDVTLLDNALVANYLLFSAGKLIIGNYNINATWNSGYSSSSYVVTNGTGVYRRDVLTSSYTFPVGTSTTSYTPITLDNSAGASGRFDVRVCQNIYSDGTCGGTQLTIELVNKTWQVATTSASPNYTVTAQWNGADESGDFDRSLSFISLYTGGQWTRQGARGPAAGADPYTYAGPAALTAVGPIGVGGGLDSPLPIELLSFEATLRGDQVDLRWLTASETNNDYFTVQKSMDGIIFLDVAEVNGAGNSTATLEYGAVDAGPFEGVSYYRLKQTDFNGEYSHSNLVAVQYDPGSVALAAKNTASVLPFPNPATNESINVKLDKFGPKDEVLVVVMDNNGREFYSKVVITDYKGYAVSAIDPYQRLAPGLYLVVGSSNNAIGSEFLIVTE